MIQLSYVSSAASEMSPSELLKLLQQCLKNNPPLGVTGMLLYGNETFLQTIEGDDAVIERLVERIAKDPRHTRLQFFGRKQIERRRYAEWSMGFKRISDQELGQIEGLKSFGIQDQLRKSDQQRRGGRDSHGALPCAALGSARARTRGAGKGD